MLLPDLYIDSKRLDLEWAAESGRWLTSRRRSVLG